MIKLTIIGAGPAGISLAAEGINSGLKPQEIVVFEKEKEHSFSIRKFYPEAKPVTANYKGNASVCEGILCLADTTKEKTISLLSEVIENYQIPVRYNDGVHKITPTEKGYFLIETNSGDSFISQSCAVAIGVMGRPNKPDYKISSEVVRNVFYDITSFNSSNEKILVVGGGDSASEYVQFLQAAGNDISISYRRDSFSRMNDINLKTLNSLADKKQVKLLLNSNIVSLEKEGTRVKVHFKEGDEILFDKIVYALGGTSPKHFLKSIGIRFEGQEPTLTGNFETTVPGLFLVGDLSAGKSGGSIISAFNSSHRAMNTICKDYLDCSFKL